MIWIFGITYGVTVVFAIAAILSLMAVVGRLQREIDVAHDAIREYLEADDGLRKAHPEWGDIK